MMFRVVLISNGEYKKTLHKCKTRETAFINFHKIKNNNNVMFPRKFINTKGIKPVKYQIYITKVTENGDVFRILRDSYGKTYTEKPLGDWTVPCGISKSQQEKLSCLVFLTNLRS
jgi:hypothetical protein